MGTNRPEDLPNSVLPLEGFSGRLDRSDLGRSAFGLNGFWSNCFEKVPRSLAAPSSPRPTRGSVLSFEVAGGKPAASKLLSSLKLVRPAVTLGGPETLISHSASSTHNSVDIETKTKTGLNESLLRISVGLESVIDIKNDLENALKNF